MKKILSLVMVVAMLVAVLALVGCNDTKPADTTAGTTTAGSTTADTTTAGTTTADTTTAGTTTAGTTAANTTTAGTTTAGTTTAGTTTAETTTAETTTLPPVFARLDFGEKSKAEDLGMTSHAYLVGALTTDDKFISVTYTDDSIIVTAVQDHPEIKTELDEDGDRVEVIGTDAEGKALYGVSSYALCFDDLVAYEFDDVLSVTQKYMRIRIKNNTTNNIMSFRFRRGSDSGYFTTTMGTCLYLQGGAPTVDDYVNGDHKLTCDPLDVYKSYTYDMTFYAAMGRFTSRMEWQGNSFVHMAYYAGINGGNNGYSNWSGANQEIIALQFSVLGAYSGRAYWASWEYGDTRANIKAGNSVEIDYIIFGASKADLNTYVSYDESASISASKSISVAESEAAATATTAAA